MTGKTHFAAGLAIGCGICVIMRPAPEIGVCAIAASTISCLLPDIDTAHSKIGRRIAPVAWLLRILFGHRQFFHSLLCWASVSLIAWLVGVPSLVAIGIAAGSGSHLLLDMLNPSGVQLLWPSQKRISIASIRCGGLWDFVFALLFTGLAFWLGGTYIAIT